MTDIHTHLLPEVDDGSESMEETKEMLSEMIKQGVDRVFATPHFYADNEDPEEFLERRNKAFEKVTEKVANDETLKACKVIAGAEVRYFNGIGMTDEVDELLLGDTNCMLLEMPDKRFSQNIIDDLINLRQRRIHPIIAHLNRYNEFNDDEFIYFCNMQAMPIQLNTECIIDRSQRRRALELIAEGSVQFLATDCHGLRHRRPNLKEALDIVRNHTSDALVEEFLYRGTTIL